MSLAQHRVHIPLHKNVIVVRLPSTSVECFCWKWWHNSKPKSSQGYVTYRRNIIAKTVTDANISLYLL